MNRVCLKIAGRSFAFSGTLPDGIESSFAGRFISPDTATPDIAIRIATEELLAFDLPLKPIYEGEHLKVYKSGEQWLLRYFCWYKSEEMEYSRLTFPVGVPTPIQLTLNTQIHEHGLMGMLNSMAPEHLFTSENTALLHASYIAYKDKAILFTAPSGTGKSTQARLWQDCRGAEIINGDKTLLLIQPDGCYAAGLPFAGTSKICKNRTARLAAVVYLGQSKENRLRRISGAEAVKRLLSEAVIPPWCPEDISAIQLTICNVCAAVPVFTLDCLPDESAVACLEQALEKGTDTWVEQSR